MVLVSDGGSKGKLGSGGKLSPRNQYRSHHMPTAMGMQPQGSVGGVISHRGVRHTSYAWTYERSRLEETEREWEWPKQDHLLLRVRRCPLPTPWTHVQS